MQQQGMGSNTMQPTPSNMVQQQPMPQYRNPMPVEAAKAVTPVTGPTGGSVVVNAGSEPNLQENSQKKKDLQALFAETRKTETTEMSRELYKQQTGSSPPNNTSPASAGKETPAAPEQAATGGASTSFFGNFNLFGR